MIDIHSIQAPTRDGCRLEAGKTYMLTDGTRVHMLRKRKQGSYPWVGMRADNDAIMTFDEQGGNGVNNIRIVKSFEACADLLASMHTMMIQSMSDLQDSIVGAQSLYEKGALHMPELLQDLKKCHLRLSKTIESLRSVDIEDVRKRIQTLVNAQEITVCDVKDRPQDHEPLEDIEDAHRALETHRAMAHYDINPGDGDEALVHVTREDLERLRQAFEKVSGCPVLGVGIKKRG